MTSIKLCTFPGCTNKFRAKGVCISHYNQLSRGGPLKKLGIKNAPKQKRAECIIEDCHSPVHCRDVCVKHYMRIRAHGSPQLPIKKKKEDSMGKCTPLRLDNNERMFVDEFFGGQISKYRSDYD